MDHVISTSLMRAVEQTAIDSGRATESELMERAGMAAADALRLAAEDLRAYYSEAADDGDGEEVAAWYWTGTHAGHLARALRPVCMADGEAAIRHVGDFMLIPEGYRD